MKVVVLDTGVNLEGVERYNFVEYEDERDNNGHGTLMSKIIREETPNAEIVSVKVCDRGGSGVNDSICRGLVKCVELLDEGDIINISLGIAYKSINVETILDMLIAKGVKVCCASGNGETCYPSKYRDGLISVGACDEYGNKTDYTVENSFDVLEYGVFEYTDRHGHKKVVDGTSVACARYTGKLVGGTNE